ncbi:MAG: Fe-S cluster assembly protein SufB [Candidatus Kerfeldbacteria bacterium RIFOXYA2_FULL_38_24]|uniref:Fe-S cluster assembly protein SufB n=1 Tax=Candidatus Kerfeldbacteria bacterium RIFOXYB2_FULL_38_14 TaxID=1798547 RepID=A0A1G2BG55_9BACT|nr:MAG: Fe-S cluster assembly protein SufB [Candidatus Kerfeldbacteria bacterium RIFOXYA2_FULL_38_24]OGY88112.1 MAG: Fe-S cluster assembly protein SufB [Candidatus Kerfeldbacteria bacterium RIFOXYB2_FULL_38_14]
MPRLDKHNKADYIKKAPRGLSENLVRKISQEKKEPAWILKLRLAGLRSFYATPLPGWGPDLSALKFEEIIYYAAPDEIVEDNRSWKNVPKDIKKTFEALGIPEAEKKVLAGVGAQYESETVYHRLKNKWEKLGVIFEDMDTAVQKHKKLVQKYFMKCVAPNDHKFSALHAAVWSGGTFLYVPAGVKVQEPLQAYFRMNAKNMGQFEHTLIIIEENAQAHYIEGCSAPKYGTHSLHAGCVEIFVKPRARFRYSSVENWSADTYNLNTKRALVEKDARMEWVGGNMGSGVTMLYPSSILRGQNAHAEHLGLAYAGRGQIQDTGAKVFHAADNTTANIVMKSISKDGGDTVYRGLIEVASRAKNVVTNVKCDALILDKHSHSHTIPKMRVANPTAEVIHEASVGKVDEENVFYLQTRGLSAEEAASLIVNGFIEPIVKELPLEYAVEMNRLIEINMENSVG